jgi:hypothetical protein
MNSQPTLTIEQKQPDSGVLPASERFDSKPAQPALVKYTQHSSPAEKTDDKPDDKADLRRRLSMLDTASAIVHNPAFDGLPKVARLRKLERIEHCTRRLAAHAGAAVLVVDYKADSASWANVQRCDLWACPYCAPHKAAQELLRLRVGLAEAQRQGFFPLLITLTLRHKRGDRLAALIDKLYRAKNRLFSGEFYQRLRKRFELLGHNRYTESPFGENGWHPHLHLLWFTSYEFGASDAAELQAELKPRWIAALASVGASATDRANIALDVRPGDSEVVNYLAKTGKMPASKEWGIDSELANAPAKRSRGDGFTAFELLALASGDPEARADRFAQMMGIEADQVRSLAGGLWREYYEATQSRQMVCWGNGLLLMFQVDQKVKALEEAEQADRKPVLALHDYALLRQNVGLYCEVMAAGAAVDRIVALLTEAELMFRMLEADEQLLE